MSTVNTYFVTLGLPAAAPFRGTMLIDARTEAVQAAVGGLRVTNLAPVWGQGGLLSRTWSRWTG